MKLQTLSNHTSLPTASWLVFTVTSKYLMHAKCMRYQIVLNDSSEALSLY